MPYQGYGPANNRRYYWVNQIKDAVPFQHGFAPNSFNFIKNLVFHECSIPFQVYLETFLPCFINLLLFTNLPDFNDIVRAGAEVISTSGVKGGRRGARHSGLLGLPAPDKRGTRANKQDLQALLRVTAPLETIGYVMLLYAGTERFFMQWNSALYGFAHCGRPPSEGPLQRHANPHATTSTGTWENVNLAVIDQNRASWPTTIWNVTVPRGHYSVTWEVTFRALTHNQQTAKIGFRAPFSLLLGRAESAEITLEPGQTGGCIVHQDIYFPLLSGGEIWWEKLTQAAPIGVMIESASISIYSFQPGRLLP